MLKVVSSEVRYAELHTGVVVGLWRYCWMLEWMSTSVSGNALLTVGSIETHSKQRRSIGITGRSCSYFSRLEP